MLKPIFQAFSLRFFLAFFASWRFKFFCLCLLFSLLTACQVAPTPTPVALAPSVMPKLLATVYISPTPDEAEQQATQLAERIAAPTEVNTTPTPQPTVYIGVFIGESGSLDNAAPVSAQPEAAVPDLEPVVQVGDTLFADCPNAPDDRFGTVWRQNTEAASRLGCPIDMFIPYEGTSQVFERGVMYYNLDGAIWAIASGGSVGAPYWAFPQAPPVQLVDIAAPEGMRSPVLGFGAMWQGVPGVRDALGFARTDENNARFAIQRYQGGALFLDSSAGQVFIFIGGDSSGTAYGPY